MKTQNLVLLILNLQFAAALQELPKPFQEGANKALRSIETDFGGGGDYRNDSPEINKYPRSQSSMAGEIFAQFILFLFLGYSSGSSFLTQERKPSLKVPNSCDLTPVSTEDSSVKSEFESVTEKINSMTLNFSTFDGMDDDDEFLKIEEVKSYSGLSL